MARALCSSWTRAIGHGEGPLTGEVSAAGNGPGSFPCLGLPRLQGAESSMRSLQTLRLGLQERLQKPVDFVQFVDAAPTRAFLARPERGATGSERLEWGTSYVC
jgi:hypothetical protein